jgi:hypothetical protein
VRSVSVPWAEPDSGYTAPSWGAADRIMQRASATEAALPQVRDKKKYNYLITHLSQPQ